MKKILIITLVLVVSLIIGVLAILTAIKLTTQAPVTPNAPEVKPKAQEVSPTLPPNACTVTFVINTPTPGPSITPSPSPSPGPSATPTPSPNPSVTPSPTPVANIPPTCTGLSASPTSGDAPLLVNFVASGFDDSAGFLAGFEFNFGDGGTKKIEQTFKTTDTFTISHSYAQPGSYIATVRVKDNNGDWSTIPDACKQTITVTGAGPTVTPFTPTNTPPPIGAAISSPSATPVVVVPKIPTAGNVLPAILTIGGGAILFLLGWVVL